MAEQMLKSDQMGQYNENQCTAVRDVYISFHLLPFLPSHESSLYHPKLQAAIGAIQSCGRRSLPSFPTRRNELFSADTCKPFLSCWKGVSLWA